MLHWIRQLFGIESDPDRGKLQDRWGRSRVRRERRDLEHFDRLAVEPGPLALDEQTWSDLDMDQLYGSVDHTDTTIGAQLLWSALRQPDRRLSPPQHQLEAIDRDPEQRLAIREILNPLNRPGGYGLPGLLWGQLPAVLVPLWVLRMMSVSLLVMPILAVWWPALWIAVAALFLGNCAIEFFHRERLLPHLAALTALARLLAVAAELEDRPGSILESTRGQLQGNRQGSWGLQRRVRYLAVTEPFELYDYARTVFGRNVIAFGAVRALLDKYRHQWRKVFLSIGKLDLAMSTASWRRSLPHYCAPTWTQDQAAIHATNLYHPVLEQPVGNDIDLDGRGLLVMGSNMSGKSTFLRAVAVNAITAQGIGTAAASTYRARPMKIMSSIDIVDDLSEGRSYFMAELEAMLRMVSCAEQPDHLFVVDEVFRGTNPIERVAAAVAVLNALAANNLVVAATHDLEIATRVEDAYELVHFSEQVVGGGLEFDHRLRPGPSRRGNAIALLEQLGYPDWVVARARELAADS